MKFTGGPLNTFLVEQDKTVAKLEKLDEAEIISQLLAAMPESYQTVIIAVDILFCEDNTSVKLDFVKRNYLWKKPDR